MKDKIRWLFWMVVALLALAILTLIGETEDYDGMRDSEQSSEPAPHPSSVEQTAVPKRQVAREIQTREV